MDCKSKVHLLTQTGLQSHLKDQIGPKTMHQQSKTDLRLLLESNSKQELSRPDLIQLNTTK